MKVFSHYSKNSSFLLIHSATKMSLVFGGQLSRRRQKKRSGRRICVRLTELPSNAVVNDSRQSSFRLTCWEYLRLTTPLPLNLYHMNGWQHTDRHELSARENKPTVPLTDPPPFPAFLVLQHGIEVRSDESEGTEEPGPRRRRRDALKKPPRRLPRTPSCCG